MAKRTTGTGTSRTGSQKKQPTDAIQMLEADHRKVEQLFDEFLNVDAGRQQQVAQEIFRELEVHATLEEELFYPALKKQEETDDLTTEELDSAIDDEDIEAEGDEEEETVEEIDDDQLAEDTVTSAYDDHRMVRDHITRLREMDASSPEFRQAMVELQDMVTDHVSVEEDELFNQARISLDTKALGRQMQERKADILSAAA
ncbi:MAG TPA: hemerythrin domain-containing protein [Nitrospira sp.]|nr:hemerythrin domain-containing protein [Nitrospira sp.]